jgi:hypothetical protein
MIEITSTTAVMATGKTASPQTNRLSPPKSGAMPNGWTERAKLPMKAAAPRVTGSMHYQRASPRAPRGPSSVVVGVEPFFPPPHPTHILPLAPFDGIGDRENEMTLDVN